MLKRIHINQHNIRHNAKNPDDLKPPITVKTYKENIKGFTANISGDSKLVYSPDKPLDCGAKVWIETSGLVSVENGEITSYVP